VNKRSQKLLRLFSGTGLEVPKHAVTVGIIVGGVLGSLLAAITLYVVRQSPDGGPARLEPVRAVAPRPAVPFATPLGSARLEVPVATPSPSPSRRKGRKQ
jgi:hypothetical protein